jgi:uncharacterized membrane protein
MRTTADRIRHTVGFELIGLLIFAPLASWCLATRCTRWVWWARSRH